MNEPLVPCPSCSRHLRASETACPFCEARIARRLGARPVPTAPPRLSRAAAFVFGATITVTGCASAPDTDGGGDTAVDSSVDQAVTQDVALDATQDANSGMDAADVVGDASLTDSGAADAPVDDGAPLAMYGGPPPPDSGGTDGALNDGVGRDTGRDGGGIMPLYGGPPPADV